MSNEDVTIPARLVPYVAEGLRVALTGLKVMQLDEPDSEEARQADQLRAMLTRAFKELPDALRPEGDLLKLPERP
jgi:hypothetical protein